MPAAATARRSTAAGAARRPAARAVRPAPRPVPRPAPRSAPGLVPVAVGRTAIALGGLADSGLVVRLTRSRLWIGLLATLLVGIVALNVAALSFNAASSKSAAISDELLSENSALASEIAAGLSNERLQDTASNLGLVVPEPGTILYLNPSADDAATAARRLRNGKIGLGTAYVAPVAPLSTEVPSPEEAAAVAEGAATTEAPPVVPAADAAATPAPTTDQAAGGGVAMP